MTDVKIFNSPMFGELRVTRNEKGELLFCLTDVCKALDLQTGATKLRLEKGGISSINTPVQNQYGVVFDQTMVYIDEPNFYRCVFGSRKKTAKNFQDWVFNEVLPSLRTTGAYVVTKEEDSEEDIIARGLIAAKAALARREQRIKELECENSQSKQVIEVQGERIAKDAPKVEYYDNTLASTTCITTTQVADDLHITARTLNAKLKELGIIYSQSGQWHLKMPYKGWNLAGTRTYNYQSSNGETLTSTTLVWNQRGKRFIIALYNNDFNVKRAIAELAGDNKNK